MFSARDKRVHEVAKRQEGVVAYRQLVAAGHTKGSLRLKLASGEWIRELPSVVRLYWAEEGWLQRVWAASLWAGPHSFISHGSAAVLVGLDWPVSDVVHVTGPCGVPPQPWIQLFRSTAPLKHVRSSWGGIAHSSATQTLIDMARALEESELKWVVRRGLESGVLTLQSLADDLRRRRTCQGSRGAAMLRRIFESESSRPDRSLRSR